MNEDLKQAEEKIKELEKTLFEHGRAAGELNNRLEAENFYLKEVLFVCGEVAVSSWDDIVVGIVDRALNGFKISKERYHELLAELTKPDKT